MQEMPFLQQVRDTSNNTLDILLSNLSANIGTVYGQANTATSSASNALTVAQASYAQANSGFSQANAAFSQANAAYTAGNTGITNAATALSVAEAAYATANVGISNSGVTSGSYGSGSAIPEITVDSRGRITAVSTTAYNTFTSSSSGIVPASGGGTSKFLRADETWDVPAIFSAESLAGNGYVTFNNGLILQWGSVNITNGGSQTCNYNITFPNNAFFVTGQMPSSNKNYVAIDLYTTSQFVVSYFNGGTIHWFAIGN